MDTGPSHLVLGPSCFQARSGVRPTALSGPLYCRTGPHAPTKFAIPAMLLGLATTLANAYWGDHHCTSETTTPRITK
jgi:hypothetical protein